MIEQALIFALGFLLCALLSLLILPTFWRRAVRLSTRRLEMLMPLSMSEVMAQRDQLRAQAAIEQRRIEQKLEAMTHDRARHMSELGRNAGVVAGLQSDIRHLNATLGARESDLRDAWSELGSLQIAALDMAYRLRLTQDAIIDLERLRDAFEMLRLEKAALDMQVKSLRADNHQLRQRLAALQMELVEKSTRSPTPIVVANEAEAAPLLMARAQPDHQIAAN